MVAKGDKGTTTHVKWVITEDKKRKKLSVLIGDKSDAWRTTKRAEPWHSVADIDRLVIAHLETFAAKTKSGGADGEPRHGDGGADGPDGDADGDGGASGAGDGDAGGASPAGGGGNGGGSAGGAARGDEAAGDEAAVNEAAGDERADSNPDERGGPSSPSDKQTAPADAAFALPATQPMEMDEDSNSEGPGSPVFMADLHAADGADDAGGAGSADGADAAGAVGPTNAHVAGSSAMWNARAAHPAHMCNPWAALLACTAKRDGMGMLMMKQRLGLAASACAVGTAGLRPVKIAKLVHVRVLRTV